jgi:hypothetical protein
LSSTRRHAETALAYPEPPAHPLWHRHGPKPRPLTPKQQQRNRELLLLAQHTPRPRSRPATHQAEAGR